VGVLRNQRLRDGRAADADGIDGIHAHMTNTLNTPIEAIERRCRC
jgi:N-methylhydantoinase B/oxoprolinase/acetone carboxylase alpha subunit